MAVYTATGAKKEYTCTITFKNQEHKDFYLRYLKKCRYQDVYHQALVYCLGIDRDTRSNVNRIYDFNTGCVKTECLREGWMTSGSERLFVWRLISTVMERQAYLTIRRKTIRWRSVVLIR